MLYGYFGDQDEDKLSLHKVTINETFTSNNKNKNQLNTKEF